jgi:hypothetical protein
MYSNKARPNTTTTEHSTFDSKKPNGANEESAGRRRPSGARRHHRGGGAGRRRVRAAAEPPPGVPRVRGARRAGPEPGLLRRTELRLARVRMQHHGHHQQPALPLQCRPAQLL